MISLAPTPECATKQPIVASSQGASSRKGDAPVSFADCLRGANEPATSDAGTASQKPPAQAGPKAVAVVAGQSDAKPAAAELEKIAQKALKLPAVAPAKEKKSKDGSHGKENSKHGAHKSAVAKVEGPHVNGVVVAGPSRMQRPASGEVGTASPNAAVQGEVAKQDAAAVPAGAAEKYPPEAKSVDGKSAVAPVAMQAVAPIDADHVAATPAAAATDTAKAEQPASAHAAFGSVVSATSSAGAEASVAQVTSTGMVAAKSTEPRGAAVHGVERQARAMEVGALESSAPNRLEVGLRGGTLGWLNVRAEVAADGSIHTLLRGSAGTAEALTAQLGELHRHLSDHAIEVQQITVAAVKPSAATGFDASSRGETNPGSERGGQEHRRDRAESVSVRQSTVPDEDEMVSVPLVSAMNSGNVLANTGGWLSVRA